MHWKLASARKQWASLSPKLNLLACSPLGGEQWQAIAAANENPADPTFFRALPLIVATFRQAAIDDVYTRLFNSSESEVTFSIPRVHDASTPRRHWAQVLARHFDHDIREINHTLFGIGRPTLFRSEPSIQTVCHAGIVSKTLTPSLHGDDESICELPAPNYLARLISLPTQFIDASLLPLLSSEALQHVQNARESSTRHSDHINRTAEASREYLRDNGILVSAPINTVTLSLATPEDPPIVSADKMVLASHIFATLHCSAPAPGGGARSVLLHTFGKFREQPLRMSAHAFATQGPAIPPPP